MFLSFHHICHNRNLLTSKKKAQEILIIIKILCFIDKNNIELFHNKIESKYNNRTFHNFFEYFGETYIDDISYFKRMWNCFVF